MAIQFPAHVSTLSIPHGEEIDSETLGNWKISKGVEKKTTVLIRIKVKQTRKNKNKIVQQANS